MLDNITPIILTYNEAANIRRTLSQLTWASRVVVVDSFSTDETLSILNDFPNVSLYQRKFDTHANQWRFAALETAITTTWILRLDADYYLSDALIAELRSLRDNQAIAAYKIGFDYAIFGKRLKASLYPAKVILARLGTFRIAQHGHTDMWLIDGPMTELKSKIIHDDQKSLERWVMSQLYYMQLEHKFMSERRGLQTWLRNHPPLMPICMFFYCLFGKRLIFQGWPGIYYALQRTVAEGVLSLVILDRRLRHLLLKREEQRDG